MAIHLGHNISETIKLNVINLCVLLFSFVDMHNVEAHIEFITKMLVMITSIIYTIGRIRADKNERKKKAEEVSDMRK